MENFYQAQKKQLDSLMSASKGSYRRKCIANNEAKLTCPACGKQVHRTMFLPSEGICRECYEVYAVEQNELIDKRSEHEEYIMAH